MTAYRFYCRPDIIVAPGPKEASGGRGRGKGEEEGGEITLAVKASSFEGLEKALPFSLRSVSPE